MADKRRIGAMLAALVLLGCKGVQPTSAASGADGASQAAWSASGGGTQVENVPDTTLNNMTAYSVTIPAKWTLKGVVLQASAAPCGGRSPAFEVWRATSPDRQSFAEKMPDMLWVTGSGPMFAGADKRGCLPLPGQMRAQEFARHLATTMRAASVADEPVPAGDNAKAQQELEEAHAAVAAAGMQPQQSTVELARTIVSYKNGNVPMKGRIKVQLFCIESGSSGFPSMRIAPSRVDKCTASAEYIAAPESQFAGVIRQWDAPGMGAQDNNAWNQAWLQRALQQQQQQGNAFRDGANKTFVAHQQLIQQTMDVQQQQHDQFMETMRQQGQSTQKAMIDGQNAQATQASDVVDYALNRQTVMNTNTGQTYKITNQVTVGGDLQQVHGNGTPQ